MWERRSMPAHKSKRNQYMLLNMSLNLCRSLFCLRYAILLGRKVCTNTSLWVQSCHGTEQWSLQQIQMLGVGPQYSSLQNKAMCLKKLSDNAGESHFQSTVICFFIYCNKAEGCNYIVLLNQQSTF